MNSLMRNVLVSSSLVLLIWTGCNGDDGTSETTTTASASSSGPTSTGTSTASSSGSGQPTTSSSVSSSSTGAGASGPGCDDIPPFPPGPTNGECIPGYGAGMGGAGGGGVGGMGAGGGLGGGLTAIFGECNPVSQEGCNFAAGAECDIEASGNFQCFPSGNTEPACAACDNANGPWCQPGMHCDGSVCRRYCCDDTDCGPSLTCDKTIAPFDQIPNNPVGLCVF